MKNKKKLKLLLILILIILFIKIFFFNNLSNMQITEDFLFLKLLGNGFSNTDTINNLEEKQYNLKVNYKNIDFKSINLSETTDKKTLVHEKISPGTSGNFNIILEANKISKYKILFNSVSEKPQNLNFKAIKDKNEIGSANSLEELQKYLTGYIGNNEKVNIKINWYWKFEKDDKTDLQDTKDAKSIKNYQFDISAIGEEIT